MPLSQEQHKKKHASAAVLLQQYEQLKAENQSLNGQLQSAQVRFEHYFHVTRALGVSSQVSLLQ